MDGYFRIYDQQTGGYLATGYNAESFEQLRAEYVSYVSIDTDESDLLILSGMNEAEFINHLESSALIVETSQKRFPDYE